MGYRVVDGGGAYSSEPTITVVGNGTRTRIASEIFRVAMLLFLVTLAMCIFCGAQTYGPEEVLVVLSSHI